ncbi:MAG TPA: hypothetical protein VFT53_02215 [Candidatus Saccharimonadales bacterium]|nr:hypothetical protein [Candidatus Saccharimonadales bacterium]
MHEQPRRDYYGCVFALTVAIGAAAAIGAYISAERFNAQLHREYLASLALHTRVPPEIPASPSQAAEEV